MNALEMPGLRLGPMGGWLSAVGVLRALARADPDATLWWDGPVPVLATAVAAPERELSDRMAFPAVVTPWQSGGGWGAKDVGAARRLDQLRRSADPRLAGLRAAVEAADRVLARLGPGVDKATLVRELRGWLPEAALPWLDVAVPLHDDPPGSPVVGLSPLAGTGGNDGRWDISTNLHAAALALAGDSATARIRSRGWLGDLLDGGQDEPLVEMSGGPHWPQMDTGHKLPLLNPWAMVLTVEGLCAFGDRRVAEVNQRRHPWTTSGVDEPAVAGEPNLGEVWLPVWRRPATMPEVVTLLGGDVPRWRGRHPYFPAGMYGALNGGGHWPAGCGAARYGLVRRRGRNHEAALLDLVLPAVVEPDPAGQVAVLAGWLAGVADTHERAIAQRDGGGS